MQRAQQERTAAVEKHVVRLEIAMQHTLTVNELQATDDLYGDANLHVE